MHYLPAIFNIFILCLISLLHFYWIMGGHWGYGSVIPTDSNGRKLFRPSIPVTLMVPLVLLFFAFVNLAFCGLVSFPLRRECIGYCIIIIGAIFLLRAIGDFRYVGFTKRYRKTRFAKMDTRFYSPLCFILAVSHFVAALYPVYQ